MLRVAYFGRPEQFNTRPFNMWPLYTNVAGLRFDAINIAVRSLDEVCTEQFRVWFAQLMTRRADLRESSVNIRVSP